MPYKPVAIALRFNLLGVKTVNACARTGTDAFAFSRWYPDRLNVPIHLDVAPSMVCAFNDAMERAHALSLRTANQLLSPDVDPAHDRVTRPSAIAIRDRIARVASSTNVGAQKRSRNVSAPEAKSPRSVNTYQSSETSAAHNRPTSTPSALTQATNPLVVEDPVFPPMPPTDRPGEQSLFSRDSAPSRIGAKRTFDESVNASALELPSGFYDPHLTAGVTGRADFPGGGATLLVIEAGATRSKSLAMAKSIAKHVNGIVRFCLDARAERAAALTGDGSLAPLRDYLESLSDPGRTAPAPGRHALSVWAGALGIDWPRTTLFLSQLLMSRPPRALNRPHRWTWSRLGRLGSWPLTPMSVYLNVRSQQVSSR